MRIPNPFFEGRNRVYVLTSDPVTMIDTGVATEKAWNEIVAGLAEHGLEPSDVKHVILTHKHIDHIGNAWRFQRESDCEILIHESEMFAIDEVDPDGNRFRDLVTQRLAIWGVPHDMLPDAAGPMGFAWQIESAHASGLTDGQTLLQGGRTLEVIHTPGHSRGSICLKHGRTLFSGDHVLPDLSPNIGGGDMRQRGLLGSFMTSLQRMIDLSDDIDQVLPGHGDAFSHLEDRSRELISHHDERLDKTRNALRAAGRLSVYETAEQLFGKLDSFHIVLGCAEALAHLEYLEDNHEIVQREGRFELA